MRGVGRERTVDIGFERRKVDLDYAVVILSGIGGYLGVGPQVVAERVRTVGHFGAARRPQVTFHRLVVGEERTGGAHFGAHVADRGFAGGRERRRTVAEVFDHGVGASLDGEDAGQFQDHIFRRSPSAQFSGELHADDLRHLQLPGDARHHVDGIRAAHADRDHAQAPGVGGVRVGADHHAARERIVLQHDLVDDPGAGLPEADAVAVRHAAEEVVHFAIRTVGRGQVFVRAHVGLDQVVAVHRGGDGRTVASGVHELQQRHLRRRVLHRHAVGTEIDVVRAADVGVPDGQFRPVGVEQVRVKDFLGECQRRAGGLAGGIDAVGEGSVNGTDQIEVEQHLFYRLSFVFCVGSLAGNPAPSAGGVPFPPDGSSWNGSF